MRTPFILARRDGTGIVPNDGEQLGIDLMGAALALTTSIDNTLPPEQLACVQEDRCQRAATLYVLAAAAYRHGAGASIGHNRSERYNEKASYCLREAERLSPA